MAAKFEIKINLDRLDPNYKARLARGLQMAGVAWQAEARQYPEKMQGPWAEELSTRTGNLAKSANFQVLGDGKTLNLTAPFYYRYLLFGTGLFGPFKQLIYPVNAQALRIPFASVWGGGPGALYTKYVRGSIWAGKLAAVKQALIKGIKLGVSGPIS